MLTGQAGEFIMADLECTGVVRKYFIIVIYSGFQQCMIFLRFCMRTGQDNPHPGISYRKLTILING